MVFTGPAQLAIAWANILQRPAATGDRSASAGRPNFEATPRRICRPGADVLPEAGQVFADRVERMTFSPSPR